MPHKERGSLVSSAPAAFFSLRNERDESIKVPCFHGFHVLAAQLLRVYRFFVCIILFCEGAGRRIQFDSRWEHVFLWFRHCHGEMHLLFFVFIFLLPLSARTRLCVSALASEVVEEYMSV